MRLFFAFDLPEEIRRVLWKFSTDNFMDSSSKIVPTENIHVTLKFLGEVTEKRFAGLREKAEKASLGISPFTAKTGGYRILGGRVGCVETEQGGEMFSLVCRSLEEELSEVGFEKEKRKYFPHVTLVRFKKDPIPAKTAVPSTPNFEVRSFKLYKSELTPEGAIYTSLEGFPLKGEKNG
ncbi:RNA 2',3'-cyclic phosphodiesterase [candidate division WOR-3 bacterium]|nr:RNA 2',3'-cyclic phosphodiesterase [candidate division WOR-3 bacterium]